MPLIIDTNVFHKLIPPSANRSASYDVVYNWIHKGRGSIVSGGSKYAKELRAASKYVYFFVELDRARRLLKLNDEDVDVLADNILAKETDQDFDDEHLIAMAILARAFAVCTADERAETFIRKSEFYPKGFTRPRILKETTPCKRVSEILNAAS